ncbi:MAG: PDGLE domain-containing protein [Methanobacterium sp.]
MSPKDRNLVIAGVIICVLIAVLAPFIASTNPDGLEKSAQSLSSNPEPEPAFQSPLADYTLPILGEDNPYGGIISLVIGVFVTLLVAYMVALVLKRRKAAKSSK